MVYMGACSLSIIICTSILHSNEMWYWYDNNITVIQW